ncbi:MAG: hypothetical protein M3Y27_21100 [Acidobacteriota bacterium]|nr:hypothetical protein [Acidobacteriota bacterium]
MHRILTQAEIRPHKIRHYVECRDPEFERKMVTEFRFSPVSICIQAALPNW